MDADATMMAELHRLRVCVPEVAGAVLTGIDGMLIMSDLPGVQPEHLAAIAAASHGLNRRVAQMVGQGPLHESVIRTGGATVCTYPSGDWALLTVVADPAAEVAHLHPTARAVAHRVGLLWTSLRQPVVPANVASMAGSNPVPFDPHAPLAMRTPMATLRADFRY